MSSSSKTPAADRHHGGPGSSEQEPDNAVIISEANEETREDAGEPDRLSTRSGVSGGGGEADRHHSHDPERKGN